MAPLSTDAISHFTHLDHKLNYFTNNEDFLCDGCKVRGNGSRFTCTFCSFDLHYHCAKSPNILNSNTTHSHPMSLEVHKPADTNQAQSCQICRVPVKGLAYHCKACNFWVHPLCVSPDNSRHSQQEDHSTVPLASGFVQAGQRIGEHVVAGVAKTFVCDKLKGEMNESSPLVGSSVHVSGATEVLTASSDAGGWFETIASWFESSDS